MSGVCGWIGTTVAAEEVDATLDAMIEPLPRGGRHRRRHASAGAALYACTREETGGTDPLTAVEGRPAWHQPPGRVVAAWREEGPGALGSLGGAFAAVSLDEQAGTALLAVDRLGIRPLCYALTGDGGLVFASSAESVRRHPAVSATLDPQSLYDYLFFHVIPSPATVYREISKLPPGHALTLRDGRVEVQRYWTPAFVESGGAGEAELTQDLHRVLRAAMERTVDDGSTGAFLSGGIDSSTVSGLLAERNGASPCFTIGFAAEGYDEMHFARVAAGHFGNRLIEHYVTPEEVASAIPQIALAYDEPFGNSSAVPALWCARVAADNGVQTLLAGDGGDELFAGNERYARQKLFGVYGAVPRLLRSGLIEPLLLGTGLPRRFYPTRKLARYVEQARVEMPARMHSDNLMELQDPRQMLTAGFREQIDVAAPLAHLREWYDDAACHSLLNRMLLLDWKLTLADNDLRKVNRMCELAGVEVRYPLLDDELVALSTRVPPRLKLRGLRLRHFFRNAVTGFLPDEVINKSKHGFGLPFGHWLRSSAVLQEIVGDSLAGLKERDIVEPAFLDELARAHREDHAHFYGGIIWVLAMLECWLSAHGH